MDSDLSDFECKSPASENGFDPSICRCAVDMVSTTPRTSEEDSARGRRCVQNALLELSDRKLRSRVSASLKW